MKKIFLLSFILISLFGCNSDDSKTENQQLNSNAQKLLGKWYLKGSSINGGVFQSHHHKCPKKKDFQEFLANNSVSFTGYGNDCNVSDTELSAWIVQANVLTVWPYDPILNYEYKFTIISITSQELTLKMKYATPEGMITEISYYTRN